MGGTCFSLEHRVERDAVNDLAIQDGSGDVLFRSTCGQPGINSRLLKYDRRACLAGRECDLLTEPVRFGRSQAGQVFQTQGIGLAGVQDIVLAATVPGILDQTRVHRYPVAFYQNHRWNNLSAAIQQLDGTAESLPVRMDRVGHGQAECGEVHGLERTVVCRNLPGDIKIRGRVGYACGSGETSPSLELDAGIADRVGGVDLATALRSQRFAERHRVVAERVEFRRGRQHEAFTAVNPADRKGQ